MTKRQTLTIESYNLLDIGGELQSKLSRDKKLMVLTCTLKCTVFVNSDNDMIFKRTDDDKTLTLSSQIEGLIRSPWHRACPEMVLYG